MLITSAVPVAVIVCVDVELNNADSVAGTVLFTVTLSMGSEEFAQPAQMVTFAVIRLSVRVLVHGLLHGIEQEPLQVGDAVPVWPFNCAMRAPNVAAVCALFVAW